MIVYIAGKITGDKHYKRKFRRVERKLRREGYTVLNPAQLPSALPWGKAMAIDRAMVDAADIICFLPDWRDSPGALQEMRYAQERDKPIIFWRNN